MSCRTEAGQSTGTNCAGLPLVRIGFEPITGRIRSGDTGYTSTACLKHFADMSTFEQVDYVATE